VVFFAPAQLSAEMRATLQDALVTQLLPLPVELHFAVRDEAASGGIEQRLDLVKAAITEHAAIAAFWLEVRGNGRWFLYAVDSQVDRVVLRPLNAKPESLEALVESVAVIARATTDAVLHGEPLPEEARPPPPTPPSPPPATASPVLHASTPTSALRLAAEYVGTTFARKLPWQSGFGLRADWLWSAGPYIGIGYTFFGSADFKLPSVTFTVDRYPVSVHSGLRFAVDPFVFSAELGIEIELRSRRTISAMGLDPDPERRRTVYSICPKLESEYAITSWLRVYTGLGLDFVLANFGYALELPERTVIVEPHWLRMTVHAGIAIIR
jgi:hypothetical protein